MRDITPAPARPTRADFDSPVAPVHRTTVTEVEPEETTEEESEGQEHPSILSYTFVDADGVETEVADPMDWGNRLFSTLKATQNPKIAEALWEMNSPQLARFRSEVEDGAKFADAIEEAYGAAIGSKTAKPASATKTTEPAGDDKRQNAARKFGRVPRKQDGSFDWSKAAEELGAAIERSETAEDVRAWQEANMGWIENISGHAPDAYSALQVRISNTIGRLTKE
jgi:hypothetical protein